MCWTAIEPGVLIVKVDDYWHDLPEYVVYDVDGSENHRSRFAQVGVNRISLGTGQSLGLTDPSGGTNRIYLSAVRSPAEGPRPEVGEECSAGFREGPVPCFVVSKGSYRLTIKVVDNAFDAPEYVVRRDGVDQHGNRALEMDDDGSMIYVAAGEEFFLKGTLVPPSRNRIEITGVEVF